MYIDHTLEDIEVSYFVSVKSFTPASMAKAAFSEPREANPSQDYQH